MIRPVTLSRLVKAATGLAMRVSAARADVSVGLHLPVTALAAAPPAVGVHVSLDAGQGCLPASGISGRLHLPASGTRLDSHLGPFDDTLGGAPSHVDGHQHVHAMPRIA